ncbi:hypothetical protein [Actinopolyspora mortivallis]|uniref:hypothetical protein n=1 Tax=Actinopolyspora mortivallis TaxID=33906 RepID=UPI001FE15BD6|nr:hypothetical protein [Actinopolyspora mortivallis]
MRRLSAAMAAVAVTGLVGACGTQSPSDGNEPSEEPSEITPVASVSELKKTANAAMDKAQTVRIETNTLGAPPDYQGMLPNLDCALDFAESLQRCSGMVEFAADSEGFYLESGETGPEAKKWIKVPSGKSDVFREMFGSPEQYTDLGELLPEGSRIEGSERVELDGKKALRYDVIVDLEKHLQNKAEENGVEVGPERRERIKKLKEANKEDLDYTMWVDSSGRPLKVIVDAPEPEEFKNDLRVEALYSWDEQPEIKLPPDEDTRELTPSEAEELKQVMLSQQGQN